MLRWCVKAPAHTSAIINTRDITIYGSAWIWQVLAIVTRVSAPARVSVVISATAVCVTVDGSARLWCVLVVATRVAVPARTIAIIIATE